MDLLFMGIISFIFGFIAGGVFMAKSRKDELDNGFITFNSKLYRVTEEPDNAKTQKS
jgi:hypothetical protein